MSTTITAPITLTPVAISAPVTMEVFEIQAPITLGGRSAYQSYLATSADDPLLSEAEWSASREVVPPSDPVIGAADITDATALGRSLLTAETASAARTELGVDAAITADLIRERLNQNLMPAGAWSMGANWTNNGDGTYTSNNASGYAGIDSPLTGDPNPKGLWLIVFDFVAVTSGRVSPFWSPSGNGSMTQLAGQTVSLAGATAYWIGQQRSAGNRIHIRAENGFIGTIGNIRLLRLL